MSGPYRFGENSEKRLAGVHHVLEKVLRRAILYVDFTIVCGHRTKEEQDAAYPKYSSVQWPDSKHNVLPSIAVDIAPYPKMFKATDAEFSFVAGVIVGVAREMGVVLRWGGDWNANMDTEDQHLHDWGHLEMVL